jgi:hypothetical protein
MSATPDTPFQKKVNRFVGASRASLIITCLGMVLLSAFVLYLAATGKDGDGGGYHRYQGWGWFVGPLGILFFGFCLIRSFNVKTDGEGRVLKPDGQPLAED